MLGIARLEELDRVERLMHLGEVALELVCGRRRGLLPRTGQLARRVAGGEVQLVQRDEHRLGEVERRVGGGRNRDRRMHAIEDLVRKSAVLAPEDDGDAPIGRVAEGVLGRRARVEDLPLGRATPCGEADEPHAVRDRGVEVVKMLDLIDHVPGVVRDAFEADGVVGAGPHQPQARHSHVLHRPHGAGDVHRVLRLVQHDGDLGQSRLAHP